MNTQKLCLYCSEPIKGRSDKKFCNPQCRSAYHNQKEHSAEAFIKFVNKQLRANRSAMRTACPQDKATIRKDFLKSLGMNFKYFTHTWKSKDGTLYYFCYDYGYTPSAEKKKEVVIVKQVFNPA